MGLKLRIIYIYIYVWFGVQNVLTTMFYRVLPLPLVSQMLLMFFIVEYILRIYHRGCQGLALGSGRDSWRWVTTYHTMFLGDETTKSGGGINEMEIYSPARDRIEPRDIGICIIFGVGPQKRLWKIFPACWCLQMQQTTQRVVHCYRDKIETKPFRNAEMMLKLNPRVWRQAQVVFSGSTSRMWWNGFNMLHPWNESHTSVIHWISLRLLWNGFSLTLWNYNRCSPSSLRKVWSCCWIDSRHPEGFPSPMQERTCNIIETVGEPQVSCSGSSKAGHVGKTHRMALIHYICNYIYTQYIIYHIKSLYCTNSYNIILCTYTYIHTYITLHYIHTYIYTYTSQCHYMRSQSLNLQISGSARPRQRPRSS